MSGHQDGGALAARGMAQMMRVGLYRPVHVKTLRSQKLRMLLTHRTLLQSKAIAIDNDLRGTLRNFGLKVGMVGTVRFEARIKKLVENLPDLAALIEPLLIDERFANSSTSCIAACCDDHFRLPTITTKQQTLQIASFVPLASLRARQKYLFELRGASITVTPTILPRDSNGAELASGAGRDTSAGIQFDRVVTVHRQRKGQTCPRVCLLVIPSHAI